MSLRFPVLVVDHDDTVVNSTATVHYPCFVEYMDTYHPGYLTGERSVSLQTYFEKNFDPGVLEFFRDIIGMDEEELAFEQAYWRSYVAAGTHIPRAYPGISEIMEEHKRRGGVLCVSSHSYKEHILRDYEYNHLPMPDLVFGWELEPELRKPAPYTLLEIMKVYQCQPSEILMLDDLKPGYDMAQAAGTPFAAAMWAYDIPSIERFMSRHSDYAFKRTQELYEFLFGKETA